MADDAGDCVDLDVAGIEVVGAQQVLAGERGVLDRCGGGREEVDGGGAVEAKGAGLERGGQRVALTPVNTVISGVPCFSRASLPANAVTGASIRSGFSQLSMAFK